MSLPPEERHRKRRQQVIGGTPPAQMDHASGSRAGRKHKPRDGGKWLAAQEHLYRDAAVFADEIAELDEDGFTSRTLDRIRKAGNAAG